MFSIVLSLLLLFWLLLLLFLSLSSATPYQVCVARECRAAQQDLQQYHHGPYSRFPVEDALGLAYTHRANLIFLGHSSCQVAILQSKMSMSNIEGVIKLCES